MNANTIKVMFWPNSARSMKVGGEVATWEGVYERYGLGVLTAIDRGDKGIAIQSSVLGCFDERLQNVCELPPALAQTPKSPTYKGTVDVPEKGQFRVAVWKKRKGNGETYLYALFDPLPAQAATPRLGSQLASADSM